MREKAIQKLEDLILEHSTNEEVEEELLQMLEDLSYQWETLEARIEEQADLKNYQTSAEMDNEFMYANRMC